MVFFYLGYWWLTLGRPFAQRLAIALSVEAARVSASLFLLPLERPFPDPGAIVFSYAVHLTAVAAFLALMHFGGKAIRARKSRRGSIAADKDPAHRPNEVIEAAAHDASSPPSTARIEPKRRMKILTPVVAAFVGFGAAASMFVPSALELYNGLIEARTIEQMAWEVRMTQPAYMRASCNSLKGGYFEALTHEDEAATEGQPGEIWKSAAEEMPGNTGSVFLALIDEYETQKLECRRGLADEDVGESADFRRYRESRGLPYVELADRLSRPGYLEGAMLSLRSRQQYCPGTFDTIQCAALMPNLPMHKACVDSQERGSACRSNLAAREAKLLSVLTCESNAAKQIWGARLSIGLRISLRT